MAITMSPKPVAPQPEPKVERVTSVERKPREVAAPVSNAVSNAKPPVSNGAARIARWRSKQDPEARKQRNREAVQRWRGKRKAVAP